MQRSSVLGWVAVCLIAVSCEDTPVSGPDEPTRPPVLMVTGTIVAQEVPQEDAVVDIYGFDGGNVPCSGDVLDHETVLTGRAGRFEVELQLNPSDESMNALTEVRACLHVRTRPFGRNYWSLNEVPDVWFRDPAEADTVTMAIDIS